MVLDQHIHKQYQLVSQVPHARWLGSPEKELQEHCRNTSEIPQHILEGTMWEQKQRTIKIMENR